MCFDSGISYIITEISKKLLRTKVILNLGSSTHNEPEKHLKLAWIRFSWTEIGQNIDGEKWNGESIG